MTINEARKNFGKGPDNYVYCCDCPIPDKCGNDCLGDNEGYGDCWASIVKYTEAHNIECTHHDIINHPSHYCRKDAMESIDEMVLVFGKEAVKNFCLCNVWKYRYRSSSKNGEEDLKKSDWYMRKYSELCDE